MTRDIFQQQCKCNKWVIPVHPNEAMYTNTMTNKPSMFFNPKELEPDLIYGNRYKNERLPYVYKCFILVFYGSQMYFVCSDEIQQARPLFDLCCARLSTKSPSPSPMFMTAEDLQKQMS